MATPDETESTMRIHTNTLARQDFFNATADMSGVLPSVTEHRSQTHAYAFEVSLEGNGYAKNTGQSGASHEMGATWDEWGIFMAKLYDIDPTAVWGTVKAPTYESAEHFHWLTADRFKTLEHDPTTTHRRHTWKYDGDAVTEAYSVRSCKCGAVQRWLRYGESFADLGAMA